MRKRPKPRENKKGNKMDATFIYFVKINIVFANNLDIYLVMKVRSNIAATTLQALKTRENRGWA